MANEEKRPIVIKRIKKVAGGHHGGAWKIAYADFVTAMMAFFLLMWLLGSTTVEYQRGIADHFNTPLKAALFGGSSSGDRSSIIQGGGTDLSRSEGQVKLGAQPADKKMVDITAIQQELARQEKQQEIVKLKRLKSDIEQAIEADIKLQQFKNQILLDITTEGLRIQIVDEKNRPMFKSGSAKLESYTSEILHEIARALNQVPNKISLSGHTDAQAYSFGDRGYGNWDLSADRANASRRELIVGGLNEGKIVRVVGLSSVVLFDKNDPLNPVNRRISIVVMNKQAEESATHDGGVIEVEAENNKTVQPLINGAATVPQPAPH